MSKKIRKYNLYMDESGTGEFTYNFNRDTKNRSKHLVITAIAVENDEDKNLSSYFEYVKRKRGFKLGTPFHSYEIFEANNSDTYLNRQKARELVDSLIEFFNITPIKYKVFAIDKLSCKKYFKIKNKLSPKIYKDEPDGRFVRGISYTICSLNAFRWFGNEVLGDNTKGAIIAESRDRSDKALIDAFLDCRDEGMYTSKNVKRKNLRRCDKYLAESARNTRERITSLKFETKVGECPGLEIADLISFITFLYLEKRLRQFQKKKMLKLWNIIKGKMVGKKPTLLKGIKLPYSLARSRVHKITKFSERTRKLIS